MSRIGGWRRVALSAHEAAPGMTGLQGTPTATIPCWMDLPKYTRE
jgi:hypothetical protein